MSSISQVTSALVAAAVRPDPPPRTIGEAAQQELTTVKPKEVQEATKRSLSFGNTPGERARVEAEAQVRRQLAERRAEMRQREQMFLERAQREARTEARSDERRAEDIRADAARAQKAEDSRERTAKLAETSPSDGWIEELMRPDPVPAAEPVPPPSDTAPQTAAEAPAPGPNPFLQMLTEVRVAEGPTPPERPDQLDTRM